jgi:hypothetical protein
MVVGGLPLSGELGLQVGVSLDDIGHFCLQHEAAVIELLRGTDLAELVPHQLS